MGETPRPSSQTDAARASADSVLAHAQDEIRAKLQKAIDKKKNTGESLADVLRQDVDGESMKKIWAYLNKPVAGKKTETAPQTVKDVLLAEGVVTSADWEAFQGDPDVYDPAVGRVLVESGVITQEQLLEAINQQERGGQSVWRILVNRGLVAPKQIADARKYGAAKIPGAAAAPAPMDKKRPGMEGLSSIATNAGTVSLVATILEGAIGSRATDIHLEPQPYGLRVRYRIDGLLYDIMNLPDQVQAEVVSRVKVLANMDITERRQPQDGRFTIRVKEKTYDLRAATLPTTMGEKVVLRLLDPEDVFLGLKQLGLADDQLAILQGAIAQPHGMILVTGPMGSGKTTTLYSILNEIDIFTRNVVTIEDPVEYRLPGINQVQIDSRVERTFANMLRSVVRQDANVLMVGEIRDEDTAHVGVRAAMTGHQVLSTLHTNDAAGAIDTLLHLRVQPYFLASALIAVVAQRLVRRVCPACRQAYKPGAAVLRSVGLTAESAAGMEFFKAAGCDQCYQTGYKGRTGIFEVLRMDESIRNLVLERARHEDLVRAARSAGMATLMESGLQKVRAGVVTVEELLRVTTA